jgi:hypothetical protein
MRTINNLLQAVRKTDLHQLIQDSLQDAAPVYTDELRHQMLGGLMADGSQIGTYSPSYAKTRQARGLQIDHVDGYFTGEMQQGMFLDVRDQEMVTGSQVPYQADFEGRYGPGSFTLGCDALQAYIQEVEQNLQLGLQDSLKPI